MLEEVQVTRKELHFLPWREGLVPAVRLQQSVPSGPQLGSAQRRRTDPRARHSEYNSYSA